MPSVLSEDLFFLQEHNQKRRFQQYVLSKVFGIDVTLLGIDDQKTEAMQKFLKEIDMLLTNTIISSRRFSEKLDLGVSQIDVTKLIFWCCKSLLFHKVNPVAESRTEIIAEYTKNFCRSRRLWEQLEKISPAYLQNSINHARLLFYDYLRLNGFGSFTMGILVDDSQRQNLNDAPTTGQAENETDLDRLFNETFDAPTTNDQQTDIFDFDTYPAHSSDPPGYSSDPE